MKAFHWYFLAQPAPLPEMLLAAQALPYLHRLLAAWRAAKDMSAFAPSALRAYEEAFTPKTIAGACGDYRAGWEIDRRDDEQDVDTGRGAGSDARLWFYGVATSSQTRKRY